MGKCFYKRYKRKNHYKLNVMEDIQEKAYQDDLNKAEESIHQAPRNPIPVPKVKEKKPSDNSKKKEEKNGETKS